MNEATATPVEFKTYTLPAGIVYCLINRAMPGYLKIGRTINLGDRLRSLDSTGVPLPFECVYAVEVTDCSATERLLHEAFGDHRTRPTREFFEIGEQRVIAAMRLTGGKNVTPGQDIVEDQASQEALNRARTRRINFNFDMVGVAPGTILTFSGDEQVTCVVTGQRMVEFEGREISLSAAALEAIRRTAAEDSYYQRPGAAIAGPQFWELDGESLSERRNRIEQEGNDSIVA